MDHDVDNLQFAHKFARQNLGERADAQAASNADLLYQQFKHGDSVLFINCIMPTMTAPTNC